MILAPLLPEPVGHVLYNLRPADRREVIAEFGWFNSGLLADYAARARFGFVACADDGVPVACFGAALERPGVYRVGMLTTPRWPEVGRAASRHVKRIWPALWRQAGAHRAHCYSIADHHEAHRWIGALGFVEEAHLGGWGCRGEDFKLFVRR